MVSRGQVELMGGGYYEPVMAVIPPEDRMGQIRLMSDRLEELYRVRPRGMWLAERVWDPALPASLKEAGIEYVVVDDYHFIKSGLGGKELFGYYVTEDLGSCLKVFPGSERLRYLIPFEPVERFEKFMRETSEENGEETAAVFADDGEKFGVWPGTNRSVYKNGWLERFIAKLEECRGWIEPVTFSGYMERVEPLGRVYLPTTSYMEMGRWALPTKASFEYTALQDELASRDNGPRIRRFIQGGIWRNFFSKYTEANWMHKRMLGVSKALKEAKGLFRDNGKKARRHLYMAQCNDAYWHGVFGGLYLPHLRTSVYENILRAEGIIAASEGKSKSSVNKPAIIQRDFDVDTHDEILVRTKDLNIFFSPRRGGSIAELDYRPGSINLTNTLSRRFEEYHMKLKSSVSSPEGEARSIHEKVHSKEEGLEKLLYFDAVERASLREHFLRGDETLDSFRSARYRELGDFYNGPYGAEIKKKGVVLTRKGNVDGRGVVVEKKIELSGSDSFSIDYHLESPGGAPPEGRLGVEFNLCLPGCNGPACHYEVSSKAPGGVSTGGLASGDEMGLGSTGEADSVGKVSVVDRHGGVSVSFEFKRPVSFWRFPVETVSLSEGGLERNYQGSCLVFLIPLALDAKGYMEFSLSVRVGAPV
jgi:alpha-amylase